MYTGMNLHETRKYISKTDPDKDSPTVFHLGALDQIIKNYIEDTSIKYEANVDDPTAQPTEKILFATRALLIVKFGVKRIENFIDPETNQPVTFEPEKVNINGKSYLAMSDNVIRILPTGILIIELANEILKLNRLGEEEAKN